MLSLRGESPIFAAQYLLQECPEGGGKREENGQHRNRKKPTPHFMAQPAFGEDDPDKGQGIAEHKSGRREPTVWQRGSRDSYREAEKERREEKPFSFHFPSQHQECQSERKGRLRDSEEEANRKREWGRRSFGKDDAVNESKLQKEAKVAECNLSEKALKDAARGDGKHSENPVDGVVLREIQAVVHSCPEEHQSPEIRRRENHRRQRVFGRHHVNRAAERQKSHGGASAKRHEQPPRNILETGIQDGDEETEERGDLLEGLEARAQRAFESWPAEVHGGS